MATESVSSWLAVETRSLVNTISGRRMCCSSGAVTEEAMAVGHQRPFGIVAHPGGAEHCSTSLLFAVERYLEIAHFPAYKAR